MKAKGPETETALRPVSVCENASHVCENASCDSALKVSWSCRVSLSDRWKAEDFALFVSSLSLANSRPSRVCWPSTTRAIHANFCSGGTSMDDSSATLAGDWNAEWLFFKPPTEGGSQQTALIRGGYRLCVRETVIVLLKITFLHLRKSSINIFVFSGLKVAWPDGFSQKSKGTALVANISDLKIKCVIKKKRQETR